MEYRWLTDAEIESTLNPILSAKGWTMLNVNPDTPTCRVLGAVDEGMLEGFICIQLYPVVGPFWVSPDHQDGTVSRLLTEYMHKWLEDNSARGYMSIMESPVSERFAKRYGMVRVDHPVYIGGGSTL